MTPEPIGAFVIVRNQDKQILMGERKNCYQPGSFGCPGGRLELTESIENCAKRELLEETGLTALSIKFLGVIRTRQNDFNFIHFCFECTDFEGDLELKEPDKCVEWRYFVPNALPTNILPAHLAGIDLLNNNQTLVDILE